MEFRVLGPLEASVEGRDVPLAGPKQRLVLAHLVVEANRVVPADRLIDHVWGEEAPEAARSSLQAYVSRLRRSLGADTIEARSPGYVLHARPEEVDAQRFERMAADARRSMGSDPAAAEAVLDRALALWRGPAFADLADDHSLQAEITRLEELRLSSVEDRIDAGLTLGHHADLIAELEVLVAEHPMRERLWAQLMLALYRAGRQGEALGAYRRARQILADELGIDPSPDLRRVHEQILGQDPSLEIAGRPLRGYQLFEEIGQGVVGSVHRGLQPEGGREVAVKVIHPWLADHPDFIRRFEPEAQRVGRLEHPHIVPQYDYWRDPGGAYLVMRYLRGGSLEALLQARGPSTPQTASALVEQIASALAVAHRQGVVHRDVRPSNVLFDEEGNAYLTDFSIIRDLALTDAAAVSTGAIFSLSPEEISGGPIGPATDVYGLGLLLYEVLAGRHPFADVPVPELRERHLSGTIPPISLVRPDLPGAVEEVLERATARDPLARYPDASSLASAFRFALEAGAQLAALPGVELRNPYKGLRAFGEPDTPDFFGREDLTARLAARLGEPTTEARFLAVVGPSGSGKSSAIRAGLIPAIRAGNVPDSEDWFVAEMHPGVHPFEELEAALLSVAVARPTSLLEELERDERGLVRTTRWVLPPDEAELLVVIDQFEELFTLMQDSDRRKAFLEVLRVAVSDPSSRVRVVVSLRADFYDQPLLFKAFGDLLGARTHALTGLSTDQLERAIVGPAERVGVTVEPRLVSAILTDVTDRPSALPLLQYALTELFERRTDASMTLETYHEIGRMTGALGRRAEDIFRQLDPIGKEATRQLFLRLVTVGEEGNAETRRRVLRSELTDLEVDTVAMEKAVASFDSHRLLSSDRDPVTRGPTVEVAHEALLSEWERLRGWIESAREDVRMHRRLAAAAVEWDAADRDRGFLFRGGQLERFEAWTATSGLALTAAERRFLDAGTAAREAELAEESAWRARESALERRSRIRLRALVAVFAVAALIASTLTVVTLTQRERAREQARVATARELAAAALANLDVDPELSILLAREAIRTTRSVDGSVLPEAEAALHEAITSSRIVDTIPGVRSIDWSPTGIVAVTGDDDPGTVTLRATDGEPIRSWVVAGDLNDLAFSADGSRLATAGTAGVELWDPSTGEATTQLEDPLVDASGLSFSADGRFVSGLSTMGAGVWDVVTGHRVGSIPTGQLFSRATALSPDGSQLAFAHSDTARVFDVSTARLVRVLRGHVFNVTDVDWRPDGSLLATSELGPTVRLWDPRSGTFVNSMAGTQRSDWSRDGSRLVSGAHVWKVGSEGDAQPLVELPAHDRLLGDISFGPDPTDVLTVEEDGTARFWDLGLSGDAEWWNVAAQPDWVSDVTFSPDGRSVLGSVPDSTVRMWDLATGRERLTLRGHQHPGSFGGIGVPGIAVSPNGRLIATAGNDHTVRVWEFTTGREVFTFDGHAAWVIRVRFSPDGKLLATASLDGTSRIIDVATGRELHSLEIASTPEITFSMVSVQFTPDGRSLVTASWDGSVRVWDPRTGSEVDRIEVGSPIQSISIDPESTRLAVVAGGTASVWDLQRGERLATLAGHAVEPVVFSPDGDRVALGGDRLVTLWNPEEETVVDLRGHSGFVQAVAFSPDGSRLASLGSEGTIRVWAVAVNDLTRIAEGEVTRSLTDEECGLYLHLAECPTDSHPAP